MWFTNLAGLLQSYANPSDPGRTAAEINRHLCYLRPVAPFVTAFFAHVDCARGTLIYCNAGHFPPILLRADGRTENLDKGGPLLGAVEHASFESSKVRLDPGDMLVAYSDGVLECRNSAGEEFGVARFLSALQNAKQATAQATLVLLLAAVQDFANGSSLCDDLSLLVLQRDSGQ
jgi:sigma-B regulation protein RsbU (phosphoserine phosphatase)